MSSYSSLVLHGDATEGTVRNRKIQPDTTRDDRSAFHP